MAFYRVSNGGTFSLTEVYETSGATFTIPANTLNGQDAYISSGLDAGRSQLTFTTSSGVLTLKGFSMRNYTGSSAVHSYLYKLTGYDKTSNITVGTGLSSDSDAYTTHTILQGVSSSGTGAFPQFTAYKDLSTNSITFDGTYSGNYFLIITTVSGGNVTINTPTISNSGTATLTHIFNNHLSGGMYECQAFAEIKANNSTITCTITAGDIRHHTVTLFEC